LASEDWPHVGATEVPRRTSRVNSGAENEARDMRVSRMRRLQLGVKPAS